MSSSCAALLRVIGTRCTDLAACFCRIYGGLKESCTRPMKKSEFNAVSSGLKGSEGSVSLHIMQIVSQTSLMTLKDDRVLVNLDGCLDRFVSYILNYAAIHLLSSLMEVRGNVDAFKKMVNEMMFGSDEIDQPRRRNSSFVIADFEDSVHELELEDDSFFQPGQSDIALLASMMNGAVPAATKAVAILDGVESSGKKSLTYPSNQPPLTSHSSTGIQYSKAVSSVDYPVVETKSSVPKTLPLQAHPIDHSFSLDVGDQSDEHHDQDNYSVINARSIKHERMAAFERDIVHIFPKQSAPAVDLASATLQIVRDSLTSKKEDSEEPYNRPDQKNPIASSTPRRRETAAHVKDGLPAGASEDTFSREQSIRNCTYNSPVVARQMSMTTPKHLVHADNVFGEPSQLTGPKSSKHVTEPDSISKRKVKKSRGKARAVREAEECERIARLSRPKKSVNSAKKSPKSSSKSEEPKAATVSNFTEHNAFDSATSRRHWFGRSLWHSSVLIKDEELPSAHSTPMAAATTPDVTRTSGTTEGIIPPSPPFHFSDSGSKDDAFNAFSLDQHYMGLPKGRDRISSDGGIAGQHVVHPNLSGLMVLVNRLLGQLHSSPNGKYYSSFDVRGEHKEYTKSIQTIQRKIAEVRDLSEEAAICRDLVIGQFEYHQLHKPLETFDETFFGASEKAKRQKRHVRMNDNFCEAVDNIDRAIDLADVFIGQYSLVCKKYETAPNNSSQQYLERFCVRKARALANVLDKISDFNVLVIEHCSKCNSTGERETIMMEKLKWNPVTASLSLGKSWKNLTTSTHKLVDNILEATVRSPKRHPPGNKSNYTSPLKEPTAFQAFAIHQQEMTPRTSPAKQEPPPSTPTTDKIDLADATFSPKQYQMYNDVSYHIHRSTKNKSDSESSPEKRKNRKISPMS